MNNILELINFVKSQTRNDDEMVENLALMAEPPGEDFQAQVNLPTFDGLPSFNVAPPGLGATLADKDHAVAAPMFGEEKSQPSSLGEMIIGER